jgi:acetolactate synthase-1/2/3 large subunit
LENNEIPPKEKKEENIMKMTGAEIIINTLIEQGTTDVFGYPGGQVINIYDALYKNSDRINHILTAH